MTHYSDKVISYSPIAFWRLNEVAPDPTAADSSGNGYDGTYQGPTLGAVVGPDGENVPSFDGLNDYVDTYSVGLGGAFVPATGSVAGWVKVTNAGVWTDGAVRTAHIIGGNSLANIVYVQKLNAPNNTFRLIHRFGNIQKNFDFTTSDIGWIPFAVTWDLGADEYRGYLDGVAHASNPVGALGAWGGTVSQNYTNLGRLRSAIQYWSGSLALHAVWDRVLTPAEVADLADPIAPAALPVTPPPYIPNELYTIRVYDHAGVLQLLLQKWSRLAYTQRINKPWNHQITLEFGYDDPDLEIIRNILPDWIIEVYRIDPVTGINTKVYEGFNVTIVDQVRAAGGIIINMYGVGYTQLLQRHLATPPTGEEYSTKTGLAETSIKAFVSEAMVAPTDSLRVFPGLSIAADTLSGANITYSARYVNLLSVCETLSEQGNLDFGILGGNNVGEFIFDARALWGTDYREGNSDGNIPIIFSIERDNMLIPILSLNHSAEQNYAYVGGQGQGADRVVQEVQDAAAIAQSPWGRKEFWVEARQQADTTALVAAGQMELQKRKAKQTLSFNVKQTDQSRWIRQWNLGDLITAKYYTYSFDKQIAEINVAVTSGQTAQTAEIITIEMEDLKI